MTNDVHRDDRPFTREEAADLCRKLKLRVGRQMPAARLAPSRRLARLADAEKAMAFVKAETEAAHARCDALEQAAAEEPS